MQIIDRDYARANLSIDPAEWERFHIRVISESYTDLGYLLNAVLVDKKLTVKGYVGGKLQDIETTTPISFGIKFNGNKDLQRSDYIPVLRTCCHAWLAAEYGYAIESFSTFLPLAKFEKDFIRETADTVYSWHRHLFGKKKVDFYFGGPTVVHARDFHVTHPPLDYNKVVLGVSGGKESTLCEIILKGCGYEMIPASYRMGDYEEGIVNPTATLDQRYTNETLEMLATMPTTLPLDNVTFDTLPMVSIPRYILLALTALPAGAGGLAVGAEWGEHGRWHKGTADAEFTVNDMLADCGAHMCKQIEKLFDGYGAEFQIVSPVSVLHESGILRALDHVGFDLMTLKSCFNADTLKVNWCGACSKCLRLKKFVDRKLELTKYADRPEFQYFVDTKGGMYSYTLLAHYYWENPDWPWATAMIIDEPAMGLQDYRQGYRFMKFLRETLGFTDVIYPDQFKHDKLAMRSGTVDDAIESIKYVTGFDYEALVNNAPDLRSNAFLDLPFERLFYSLVEQKKELKARMTQNYTMCSTIARYDHIPVYHEGEWKTLVINDVPEPRVLPLPEINERNSFVLKLWLGYDTLTPGITAFGVKFKLQ